jgi:hypothetical protein
MATFFVSASNEVTFTQDLSAAGVIMASAENSITFSHTLAAAGVIMASAANEITFSQVMTGGLLLSAIAPGDYWLVDENGATTTCKLVKVTGGITGSVVSSGFGTAQLYNNDVLGSCRDRAIQTNNNDVYVVLQDGIYKSTDSGATFSIVGTFSDPGTGTITKYARSGLYYVIDNNGDRLLAGLLRQQTVANLRPYIYNIDSGVFTELPLLADGANDYGCEYYYCDCYRGHGLPCPIALSKSSD